MQSYLLLVEYLKWTFKIKCYHVLCWIKVKMKSKFVFTSLLTFLIHVSGLVLSVHGSQVHFITKKSNQKIYINNIYITFVLYVLSYITNKNKQKTKKSLKRQHRLHVSSLLQWLDAAMQTLDNVLKSSLFNVEKNKAFTKASRYVKLFMSKVSKWLEYI